MAKAMLRTSFIFYSESITTERKIRAENDQNFSRCWWVWRWYSKTAPSSNFWCILILSIVYLSKSSAHNLINLIFSVNFNGLRRAYFNIIKITIGARFQVEW